MRWALVLAAAAAAAAWTLRGQWAPLVVPGRRREQQLLSPDVMLFFEVSPRHAREAEAAAVDFHDAFERTFTDAAAGAGPEVVRRLFTHRARVLTALNELRLRLPNDLELERMLAAAIEDTDRVLLEHIEDARERCGAPLLHPGPVDAAWYGRWYRASNDAVA